MRLLIDTHIALWALTDDKKLPDAARLMISDESNDVYVSAASAWEVSIKHALHPDRMAVSGQRFIEYCELAGYKQLAIRHQHVVALESLKRPKDKPAHNDPFDRIMLAQAKADELALLTHDNQIADYIETCVLHV